MEKLERWYTKYVKIFLWVLAIGLFTHSFVLTNKLINNDEMGQLFGKGATYSLGRWGLEIIKYVIPNISMQFFHGIITLILIAISSCIVSEIFKIKNKLLQVIIGGIMITFPSITGTFSYMFTASSYAVSIFLSVMSVYIASKKNWKIDLIGIVCLVFSLSLYQAYISISASLLIILLIKECLNEEKSFKQVMIDSIRYLAFLVISVGIYFILTKIINKYYGKEFSTYQSFNSVGEISLELLISGINKSYESINAIFVKDWNGIVYNKLSKIVTILIGIVNIIFILLSINKARKDNILKGILVIIFFSMLPMTMNILYILNPLVKMHTLMVYGNLIYFLIPIFLYEENKNVNQMEAIKNIFIVFAFIIILEYSILANECYTRLFLAYENTFAFYNTLSTRIQETDGFNQNTKVAIIGRFEGYLLTNSDDKFIDIFNIIGINSANQLINSYSNMNFLKYYIGVNLPFASVQEINAIKENKEYQEMNVYPYDNSIKMINNIIVVKYSNEI